MNPNDPFGEGCNVALEHGEQPHCVEHFTADGVYVRQIVVKKKGSLIPQHAHAYDHLTMIVKGSVKVWEDGVPKDDRKAPDSIYIKAGTKHGFLTLEADTILYCIHNVSRTGQVEISDEHQISGDKECHSGS